MRWFVPALGVLGVGLVALAASASSAPPGKPDAVEQWARGVLRRVWPASTLPASPTALQAAQAVARGETYYGRGWKNACTGSRNWGALQSTDGTGCAATDTHPTASGASVPYAARFRVYDTDDAGAADFLRVLLRGGVSAALAAGDAQAIAAAMHANGYFEGFGATVEDRIRNYASAIAKNARAVAAGNAEPLVVT